MPPRFCGRRDVLWRPPKDERFPDQTWLLEVENSKLKKDLIIAMDEANTLKEKIKVITVKAVKTFQQTEDLLR